MTDQAPERMPDEIYAWHYDRFKSAWDIDPEESPPHAVRYVRADLRMTVEPLVWEDAKDHPHGSSVAHTDFGGYNVSASQKKDIGFWVFSPTGNIGRKPSMFEAKAAAQADYERRILSTLTPAPVTSAQAAIERARGVIDGIELVIAKLSTWKIAQPFKDRGRDDDWRFRAKLARKETHDSVQCELRLLCDDAEASLRALSGESGDE